jgi:hypothetical protein
MNKSELDIMKKQCKQLTYSVKTTMKKENSWDIVIVLRVILTNLEQIKLFLDDFYEHE